MEETEDRDLVEARAQIAHLDRVLVAIVSARFRAVEELFRAKDRRGRPRTDGAQELRVRQRARRWAEELGAPPDATERVVCAVVREAKRAAADRILNPADASRDAVFWFPLPVVAVPDRSEAPSGP